VIVSATRDIQKDEQILCNYDLTAALGMDIPFDNVHWDSSSAFASRARVLSFSEKCAACFVFESAGGK
jgi:hypothetical protein